MREILFRGKRIDNGEWVYGNLNYGTIEIKSIKDSYYISDFDVNPWDKKFYPVIPESVGQYTGLTDKNGKKIFEGDILKIVHKYQSPFDDDTKEYTDIDTDVVHFDDEGLCFSYGKSPFLCVVDNVTAEYEVIGNIYDDNLEELANGR